MRTFAVLVLAVLCVNPLSAEFAQQGPRLSGTGVVGRAEQGTSVAVSADGNTLIIGGPVDNFFAGAAWVFVRANGVWRQEGEKLVGTGGTGPFGAVSRGQSVALSGDGVTALVGGDNDNSGIGAVWVFTRLNGTWGQLGSKLVGSGYEGNNVNQGFSVALSGDGNTALVGGPDDGALNGAAWVFTRSNGAWTQQGSKLTPNDGSWGPAFGWAVALSANGDTALIGGPDDTNSIGATWVFTRSTGIWSQQGGKLVGTGGEGLFMRQGFSVALSADGNTAIVGAPLDRDQAGAAWVFTRSSGTWSQQGTKLVGTATGPYGSYQGASVALSADGNTAVIGGPHDNDDGGAVWVFARQNGVWTQQGSKLVGSDGGYSARQGSAAALSADGTTLVVGASGYATLWGAAWVFSSSLPLAKGHFVFVQQPATTESGSPIQPNVTVQFEDNTGNPVNQRSVRVDVALGSGSGELHGSLTEWTDDSGLASFSGLWMDLAGSKTLVASSAGIEPAVSTPFMITPGPLVDLVAVGGTPQSTMVGQRFPEPLVVRAIDGFGNPVAGAPIAYTVPASGPSALVSDGGAAITDGNGEASVQAVANEIAGGPYLVTASTAVYWVATFSLTNLDAPSGIPMLKRPAVLALALLVVLTGLIALRARH